MNTITVPVTVSVSEQVFRLNISAPSEIDVGVSTAVEAVDAEHYQGPYEVTPRLYEQMLETENKLMMDDVTVYEIPITRTTNPTGGLTVLIG